MSSTLFFRTDGNLSMTATRDAPEERDLHRDTDHVVVREPTGQGEVFEARTISKRKVAEAPKIRHYRGSSRFPLYVTSLSVVAT